MEKTVSDRLNELEKNIRLAEGERDAWKGKNTEHYKLACILVAGYERERADLLLK